MTPLRTTKSSPPTSSDAQGILPGDYTVTAADNGVHVFRVTLSSTGTR